MRLLGFLILATLLPTVSDSAQSVVRIISGGPNSYDYLVSKKADLEHAAGTTVILEIKPTDVAMLTLATGGADAYIGASVENALALAEKKGGLPKQNPNDYKTFDFTENILRVGVHPNNPVKNLSDVQISDILTGKITNWESITGQNLPISVFMAKNYMTAMKLILEKFVPKDATSVHQVVADRSALLKSLEKDPGAVAFFTLKDKTPSFSPKFFETGIYHKTKFIMKKNAKPEAEKLFNWLKAQPKYIQE